MEFSSVIQKHQNIRSSLVERMPVLDEATFSGRRAGSLPTAVSTSGKSSLSIQNGVVKAAAPLVDLLDMSSDDAPAPTSSSANFLQDLGVDLMQPSPHPGTTQPSKAGADILLDLVSIGSPAPSSINGDLLSVDENNAPVTTINAILSNSPTAPSSVMDLLDGFEDKVPIYPSIVAFESSTLKIEFNFTKQPENPQATDIVASFTNRPLHIYLTTINLTDNVDLVQWIPEDIPLQSYSTGMIYNLIRDHKPPVSWAKVIWTKKGIPKHNFLAWLVLLNRCPTKDRIIGWGLTTDTMCLLCNNVPETRDHLFFDYWYSIEVWSSLAMNAQAQPIRQWNSLIAHVESLSSPKHLKLLNLLAMQAAIYFIWTERNSDFTDSSSVHPLR